MGRERGEATTAVLVVPAAMFVILVIVQAALVFHAQSIVDAAAMSGAQASQEGFGNEAAARSTVESVIGTSAASLLSDVDVSYQKNRSRLSVTVRAAVMSLIPGYTPTISSTAAVPRETFIPANRR